MGLVSNGAVCAVQQQWWWDLCEHRWMAGLCLYCAECRACPARNANQPFLHILSLCPGLRCRLGWESLFFAVFFLAAWAALSAVRHQRR